MASHFKAKGHRGKHRNAIGPGDHGAGERTYDSYDEKDYAVQLTNEMRIGDTVKDFTTQVRVDLGGVKHKIDFLVEFHGGLSRWDEIKAFMKVGGYLRPIDSRWPLIEKYWKVWGPGKLAVIHKVRGVFRVKKEIVPKDGIAQGRLFEV